MYNRYARNDNGIYTRMPQADPPPPSGGKHPPKNIDHVLNQGTKNIANDLAQMPPIVNSSPRPERDVLNRLLQTLHLGDLDAGDLLVLLLLFMLFREKADEELLIALGLLLIL